MAVACFSPIRAFQSVDGAPVSFSYREGARSFEVPCGHCVGCRIDRSRDWAIRCVHESKLHARNCFITLTYRNACMPDGMTLVPRDTQLFLKRARKLCGPFRFFLGGEYDDGSRPHYHALLFGLDFDDRLYFKRSPGGERLFRSSMLEKLWPYGYSTIGEVTFRSAAYVARYVMKKEIGASSRKREIFDIMTGEIYTRAHEFARMSLKPGIGFDWLMKYWPDVYPHGYVVLNGQRMKPPRFYDKWFEFFDPVAFAALKARRESEALSKWDDNSPRRLRAKEQVQRARLSFLKRSLDEVNGDGNF
ncbi:replication initiator protein [robinz microvirus RP_96]|nr:replication initiator protein [robinz microvirus RP_96]